MTATSHGSGAFPAAQMHPRPFSFDHIGRRKWTAEDVRKYVGDFRHVYFTYAADSALRKDAASGGSVTALLIHLLDRGEIDGALVVRSGVIDGSVQSQFTIATSRDDLIAAQGSKYMAVYFNRDAVPLIREFDGRLAVVALPCDATLLHHLRLRDSDIRDKVRLVIGLFCGHNSERELTDRVTAKLGRGHGDLIDFRYRSGNWRGHLTAVYEDGVTVKRPFREFSDYRNLYLFCERKCHYCHDHYGYNCDISAGDIWSLSMRNSPIKHTALITRSQLGSALVAAAREAGALSVEEQDVEEVLDGQSRTVRFHYNVSARARVGRHFFDLNIPDKIGEPVRWNEYIVAGMALAAERVSRTRWGSWIIWATPRPVLRFCLYIFKGLELL